MKRRYHYLIVCVLLFCLGGFSLNHVAALEINPVAVLPTTQLDTSIASMDWNETQGILAVGWRYGGVDIYDAELNQLGHIDVQVNDILKFSPDGEKIAIIDGQEIAIWQIDPLAEMNLLTLTENRITPVFAWSPDSQRLIVGGGQIAEIWDIETAEVIGLLTADVIPLFYMIEWHPQAEIIATNGIGTELILWDALSGEALVSFPILSFHMTWSPDGHTLALTMPDGIYFIDMASYAMTKQYTLELVTLRNTVWQGDVIYINELNPDLTTTLHIIDVAHAIQTSLDFPSVRLFFKASTAGELFYILNPPNTELESLNINPVLLQAKLETCVEDETLRAELLGYVADGAMDLFTATLTLDADGLSDECVAHLLDLAQQQEE